MSKREIVSRRGFLKATGGVAAATALAGCSNNSGGDGGTEGDGSGGDKSTTTAEVNEDLVLNRINSTITTFDPVASTDEASGYVIQQVFDSLTNYVNGTTATEALLAKDYTMSKDGTTYTFPLKEATFHNGDSVTASDVVYSFERLAASKNSRRASFILDSLGVKHETQTDSKGNEVYKPGTLAISAPDEKTVEIQLAAPFHSSLEILAYSSFSVVPEGIVGDIEGYEGSMKYSEFASSSPVGAGPFTLENYKKGTEASVARYEDYHGETATVGGVHWQIIEKESPQYQYAMNKNADIFGIPTSKYDPKNVNIKEGPDDRGRKFGTYESGDTDARINMAKVPELVTYYIGFNMAAVPKPVRQAVAYAANQKIFVQEVFKNRYDPAYQLTPKSIYPGGPKAYNAHVKSGKGSQTKYGKNGYPYGVGKSMLDKAKKVMEDAGYGPDNKYKLEWTQYQSTTWAAMANILRDQLTSVHIDMQITQADFATLTQRGRKGNLEVYTLGWGADWPAADNFLALLNPPMTDTDLAGPVSYLNWSPENGDAAETATKAYETITNNKGPSKEAKKAREKAYVTIEECNWEDVGFVNIFHSVAEIFWYDWLDFPISGAMGQSRQKYNAYKIADAKKRP